MTDDPTPKQAKSSPKPSPVAPPAADPSSSEQLNWFDVETKCQKLVYDILAPTISRQQQDRENIESLQKVCGTEFQKRISDIEFFILRKKADDAGHPTFFDLINGRLDQLEIQAKESTANLSITLDQLHTHQQVIQHNIDKFKEQFTNVNTHLSTCTQSIQRLMNDYHATKQETVEMCNTALQEQSTKVVQSIETI